MAEKIHTQHPQGKAGVNIDREKYEQVKTAILAELNGRTLGFYQLGSRVQARLEPAFDGNILWYYTTVKLDLEARGLLERVPDSKPQLLRLKNAGRNAMT